ncbi:MAG: DUF3090 domain-containing protein [Chloroflexi bacterium HGW-Chloroflexi-1]|nr:MAG: DUF3090 domain-containing protein [Chloroflexi bacterium HGW-Chloroflexi-1]
MAHYEDDDVYPVTRILAGAVGESGQRVFVLQAHFGEQVVSWVIEKEQALGLSRTIPQLLDEVHAEFPELGEPLVAARPNTNLNEPLEPRFRVGSIGLGYDRIHDLVVLALVDANFGYLAEADLMAKEGPPELYLYTTRGQALLLSQQAEIVVVAGRPYCPNCGEPMDDFGHFCLPAQARGKRGGGYLQ